MKILVTGGTGFIGSRLANRLCTDHEVIVPFRNGSELRFLKPRVKTRLSDMADIKDIEDIVEDVDVIFHLAAIRGSSWSFTPDDIKRINIGITENLLKAAVGRVKHFIYVSSVSVYGHFKGGPADEDYHCLPSTRYGASKYEAEKLVEAVYKEKGLNITIIRPVITYGPGDTYGMVTKLSRLINSGRYLTVGSGDNRVHLVYIDDLIDGFLKTMLNPAAFGRTYILAGDAPITINKLVEIASSLLKKRAPNFHLPLWTAKLCAFALEKLYGMFSYKKEPFITMDKIDIMTRDRSFDISRAKKELEYAPEIDYSEGLKRTVDWLMKDKFL